MLSKKKIRPYQVLTLLSCSLCLTFNGKTVLLVFITLLSPSGLSLQLQSIYELFILSGLITTVLLFNFSNPWLIHLFM